jgi:hypothetical protein
MPNHVTQILTVEGEAGLVKKLFESIQGEGEKGTKIPIDFNKIVSIPEIYKKIGMVSFNLIEKAQEVVREAHLHGLDVNLKKTINIGSMSWKETLLKADLDKIELMVKAHREHGFFYWYPVQTKRWGTKWNAYNQKKTSENSIMFDTAWSSSEKVIDVLAGDFPELKLTLLYADEDLGFNTGEIVWEPYGPKSANRPEGGSSDAFRLFKKVHPGDDRVEEINGEFRYVG